MIEVSIIIIYLLSVIFSITAGEMIGYLLSRCRKSRCPAQLNTPGWLNVSIIILLPWLLFAGTIILTIVGLDLHNVESMVDLIPLAFLGIFFVTAIIVRYYEGVKKNKQP